jgi:cell division protein FtsW
MQATQITKKRKVKLHKLMPKIDREVGPELPLSTTRQNVDFLIFITVLILLLFGTIMVFSSTAPSAYNLNGDTYHFIKKQIIFVIIGLFGMFFMMNYDYKKLAKMSPKILLISILLLIAVAIPGIGTKLNGARRWLIYGPINFQPSEMAKIGIILFVAYTISRRRAYMDNFIKGVLPILGVLGGVAALIMIEPHFSATLIICSVVFIMLFCGGARVSHFLMMGVPIIPLGIIMIITEPYRLKRLVAFLDPWSDVKGGGWQIIQSLLAIGSGGIFGRGLGRSLQKFLYIPEPYNDFIFAVLSEELGFLGVIFVLLLFTIFVWRGVKVAMNAQDTFGSMVAIGITTLIAVQVVVNIMVVTSSMPVTGMPLPFFSYGGTSLVFLLSAVGILLNISRYAKYERI